MERSQAWERCSQSEGSSRPELRPLPSRVARLQQSRWARAQSPRPVLPQEPQGPRASQGELAGWFLTHPEPQGWVVGDLARLRDLTLLRAGFFCPVGPPYARPWRVPLWMGRGMSCYPKYETLKKVKMKGNKRLRSQNDNWEICLDTQMESWF